MKLFETACTSLLLMSVAATSTYAADDADICKLYGALGESMADFLLPQTLQDLVDVMTGNNSDLMKEMTGSLISGLDGNDLLILGNLGGDKGALIGEAAGVASMQTLMSGQVSTSEDLAVLMTDTCLKLGADTLIDTQRASRAATQAITGQ